MIERKDVAPERRWHTEDLFASQEDWERTYKEVEAKLDFSEFEGKLGDPEKLLACLKKSNDLSVELNRLGIYAFLKHDEDTRDAFDRCMKSFEDALRQFEELNA